MNWNNKQQNLSQQFGLKHKIAQMLIIGFSGTQVNHNTPIVKYIRDHNLGGVILFDEAIQADSMYKNIENPQQLKKLTTDLQSWASYPLLIGIDYEGGAVNRLKKELGFPDALSQDKVANLPLSEAQIIYTTMAQTLKASGVNLNFAPVVDLSINLQNPIIAKLGRSYSADPRQVVSYAKIALQAYWQVGIRSVIKHFPGHGSSITDTHLDFVDVTHTWHHDELIPYQKLFHFAKQDIAKLLVMTSHVIHKGFDEQGYPASLSAAVTNGLLRKQLGYQGLVVTDDLQMSAISNAYGIEQAIILAINAGADLLLFCNQLVRRDQNPVQIIEIVEQGIQDGKINPARIEESYQRIISLKQSL